MLLFLSSSVFSQSSPSHWNISPDYKVSANYQMFGKSYVRGVGIGALGYTAGYYLSGHRTGVATLVSLLAVNIPIMIDSDFQSPEQIIGYNLGALSISVGITLSIELHRREHKAKYKLKPIFHKK